MIGPEIPPKSGVVERERKEREQTSVKLALNYKQNDSGM